MLISWRGSFLGKNEKGKEGSFFVHILDSSEKENHITVKNQSLAIQKLKYSFVCVTRGVKI